MKPVLWLVLVMLRILGGSRLPILVAAALLIGTGAWGGWRLAEWYQDRLTANADWVDAAPVERTSRLIGALFMRAVKQDLISVEAGSDRLRIRPPPCGDRFSPLEADPPERKGLLDLLCTTIQGAEIAAEIRQWNASFHFLAVRDDRGRNDPCDDGKVPHHAYLEAGCKSSRWEARRPTAGGVFLIETATGASPPQRDFGMIAVERRRGANDWLTIAPAAGFLSPDEQPHRLTTRLSFSGTVTVDLVGRPLAVSVNAETRRINGEIVDPVPIGPVSMRVELLCEGGADDEGGDCRESPEPGEPHAFAFRFRSEAPVDIAIALDAAPIRIVPDALRDDRRTGDIRLRRTAHIEATCAARTKHCKLAWKPVVTIEARRPGRHEILTREGKTSLVDETGRITPEGLDLGLAPVLGLGPQDAGSLTAALAASGGEDRRVALTVDRDWQREAVAALKAELACPSTADAARAQRTACHPGRRAALVLMDAEANPGEILAVASWPPVETGMHVWDVLALESDGSSRSPVAGHAWRATDKHNHPGSTFKLVTALAAAEAGLAGNPEILSLLRGLEDVGAAARQLGLKHRPSPSGCTPVEPRDAAQPKEQGRARPDYDTRPVPNRNETKYSCLQNALGAPFRRAWLEPSRTGCRTGGAARIGVCEALLTSSNLFFAGLAMRLDGDKVVRNEGGRLVEIVEPLNLAIGSAAKRLFPAQRFDLLRGQTPRVPRLMAEPIVVDADLALAPSAARRTRVALSGYGQAVQASTLAITNVFASMGSGRIVRPRLVRRDPRRPEDPASGEGDPILTEGTPAGQKDILDLIRAGLSAVANRSVGTAYKQFAEPKRSPLLQDERLFLKTGTADANDADDNAKPRLFSSWLAGWIEGHPWRGIRQRIAFACWKSHSDEQGAEACGPMIRRVLERLDAGAAP